MRTKHQLSLLVFAFHVAIGYAQCSGCQFTITAPSSATYNLTSGQVVCIIGSGSFTGQLNNFNGNTLCIGTGVTYNPSSAPNYNGNWTIINNGTFQNTNNLNFNSGTSFTNNATGTISLGNINVNSGIKFANYGTMTLSGLNVNSGANVTLGGTTTINGSIQNNGNITDIGSVTANGITNNGSGRIIGGPNTGCNYIRSTGSFSNTGIYGGTGTSLLVGNSGGSIQSPASTTVPTAPSAQASNLQLTGSGSSVNGSFTSTTAGGYLVLRATGSSVPATTNPTNFASYTAGQTLGAWTVIAVNSGQNTTTFTDASPSGCTNIYYRVYSFNATGNCMTFNTSNALAGSLAGTPVLGSTTPASRCGSGALTLSASYSLGTINWYDASSCGNLVGTGANLNLNLSGSATYYVSATFGSCTSTRVSVQATVLSAPSATANGTQEICTASTPSSLTLSGLSGSVVRWESSDDAAFTSNVASIANTSSTLSTAQMGAISTIKYYRAVLTNGSCQQTTNAVYVKYPTTTWNGSTWSDGAPDASKRVVFDGNFSLSGVLYACSVTVNANRSVHFNAGDNLVVSCGVSVATSATLSFADSASLVQLLDGYANTGKIVYNRNTAPVRRYDYTYWSSPVEDQNLLAVSPGTLVDKFFTYSPIANNWQLVNPTAATMTPGVGYIIRAPQSFAIDQTSVYSATFNGVPNNGMITTNVISGASNWNLIGNPYPSVLDLDAFFADNASVLQGTAYLWVHNTLPSSQIPGNWLYNYTSDDYAFYNATGSIGTGATSEGNGNAPTGRVASGQSFFVQAMQSGMVAFKNGMRRRDANSGFFRLVNPSATENRQRLWLNLTNDNGAFKQLLIGYVPDATNAVDQNFDGPALNGNSYVNFYSLCDNQPLSIQARSYPIDLDDSVSIGFSITAAGSFHIAIDHLDPALDNVPLWLKDHQLGVLHDLRTGRYDFEAAAGVDNGRFELFYSDVLLQREQPDANSGLIVWSDSNAVHLSSHQNDISVAQLFDLNGRSLAATKNVGESAVLDISSIASQPLLLKVVLADGSVAVRKLAK